MLPEFDPTIADSYGTLGQESVRKMRESLAPHSLKLSYESSSRIFRVIGSSNLKKEEIKKIFTKSSYSGWQPKVLDTVDAHGNRLVTLEALEAPGRIGRARDEDDSIEEGEGNFDLTREMVAVQIIYDVASLGISLKGMKCIDIGCRSGENSIAMQKAGAKVIGIDPDDSEFAVAKQKGMEETQLIKATLQQYHKQFPDNKFDLATVFLWNIHYKERDSFAAALKEIIHPRGYVIIGYSGDDVEYDKDPSLSIPILMSKVFKKVERNVFPGSLNRYLLLCSRPKRSLL